MYIPVQRSMTSKIVQGWWSCWCWCCGVCSVGVVGVGGVGVGVGVLRIGSGGGVCC